LPMLAQGRDGGGCQRDRTPSVPGLWDLKNQSAPLGLLQRLLDPERAAVEVYVLPTQRQQFRTTQTGAERQRDDGIGGLAAQALQYDGDLGGAQDLDLLCFYPRCRGCASDVASDDAPLGGMLEHGARDAMEAKPGTWGKPVFCHGGIERLQVGRLKLLDRQ